jgi:multidrug efflux pump subunit AcrA (membrane-fusion protein)
MITPKSTSSYQSIFNIGKSNNVSKVLFLCLLILILFLFLPWTQNIRTKGNVTTLRQEQRAQDVPSTIGGKIIKWYVKEGDVVSIGDTIAKLAEVKDAYLDPNLLDRTAEQISAKTQSIAYYSEKSVAVDAQISALESGLLIKTNQLKNKIRQQNLKIQSDSAQLISATNDNAIALKQFNRQKELYDQGLVSLAQLEQRNIQLQSSLARKIAAENNLVVSKQEVGITALELSNVQQEAYEKINKARSDKMSAMSDIANSTGENAKLKNQYANYSQRANLYYILAPQSGQITQAKRSGLGEIVKEGEILVEIVPQKIEYAVELFIDPLDIPLVNPGQKIRFIFDGFPAIVFSGWPFASYGTFGGIVTAIENNVNTNGKYRILVKEDVRDKKWPIQLRLGTGAQAIALLKDVPIWYELWRNLNGFPPDFYTNNKPISKEKSYGN